MHKLYLKGFTQNRELSWLRFNDRVLSEAMDETVPLIERLKFIAIYTSNLDEFFMIRVGSLFDMQSLKEDIIDNKSGMDPNEQLIRIFKAVRPMYKKRDKVYKALEKQLRSHNICQFSYSELNKKEKNYIAQYFEASIEPVLSPQIVDAHHHFPILQTTLYISALCCSIKVI